MSRRHGLLGAAALAAAVLAWPGDRPATAAVDVCAAVPADAALWAIGAASPTEVDVTAVAPGTCSWRGTSPACTMRALSVKMRTTGDAARHFREQRTATGFWVGAPGLGDEAYFTADDVPPGAGVLIEHLVVRDADTIYELTMLGRLAPESTHAMLGDVARALMT